MASPAAAPGARGLPGREPSFSPRKAWDVARSMFPPQLHVDYPSRTTPVSVTGTSCHLDCAHCGGHYLRTMTPRESVPGPRPGESFLISGGSDSGGRVPLIENMDLVSQLGVRGRLNVHSGLVDDEDQARRIGEVATTVSFDLVGSGDTIRDILGLERTVEDYVRSYRLLSRFAAVYPHVCLGLHGGEFAGEERAVDIIAHEGAPGAIFLVFMPTAGTRLEDASPPDPDQVLDFLAWARIRLPRVPLTLGCMRPPGAYRRLVDPGAVERGINGIVKPHPRAVELARELGLEVIRGEHCCSLELAGRAVPEAAGGPGGGTSGD